MRKTLCSTLLLAAALLVFQANAYGQTALGNEFTFQGRLNDEGFPADGQYDFIFRLYDAITDGSQVGSDVTINNWPVTDGLFTLQLDFGSGVFGGDARWIEVRVRGGGSDYTTLSPRQPVTAAPVALYALGGPGSGGFWAANGNDIYSTNSGNVGIGTSSPTAGLQVELPADSTADWAIKGRNPDGIGIQGTSDVGTGVTGIAGGETGIGVYGWAVGTSGATIGVFGAAFSPDGYAGYFNGRGLFLSKVGIQVPDPQASLDVVSWDGYPAVKGVSTGTGVYGVHNQSTGSLPGVWGATDSGSANATAVRGIVGSTSPGSYSAGVRGHNNGVGDLGIGVWGSQDGGGWGVYGQSPSGRGVYGESTDGYGVRGHSVSGTGVFGSSTSGYAGYFIGSVRVSVLEIAGADVAEKFPVSDESIEIQPGMVMEIDPENSGNLRVARGAYNRRVAGVVSGAGDIPTGTILGSSPDSENAPAIALNGRVWVDCTASQAPIEIGDLLTTSDLPGHAMAVSNFGRAHGAVIGKAMTPLALGETGQVLALVNLQ